MPTSDVGPGVREDWLSVLTAAVREYAIFALDPDGIVTSWNRGAEHIKGYRAEEIIGRHFSVFYPAEGAAAGSPDQALAQAVEQGSYTEEGWRVRKDGSRFWAHVVLTPLRFADGGLRGFTKITRDDSEARARLQRSSQRFSGLFTLAPVGIALFDQSQRVVEANPALGNLLGYEPQRLYGMSAVDLLAPQDRTEQLLPDTSCSSPAEPHPVAQRQLICANGHMIHCELSCVLSVEEDGSPLWLVTFQDVTGRVRQTEQLHYEVTYDALTGLPNRRGLSELLDNTETHGVAVLFCDLYNFKRINDALGHEAGDELLVALARRLQAGLAPDCTVGRLAGDEFVVVCPDIDTAGGIEALATVMQEQLRQPVVVHGQVIRVSASIGAAVLGTSAARSEDLIRFADAAMADAKRRGPGRVSLASQDLIASIDRQLSLEEQLRAAIENDELIVHYQPIVALNEIVLGAEALVRWPHPQRGQLGPDQFLPVAERGNLLRDLDCWVLRTALREASRWPRSGEVAVAVAVNLAGLLPEDPHFVDEISEAIAHSGIAPDRVVLELVETALIDLPSHARQGMAELAHRGVRFAVDDFGTGYSSLARLKHLPAHIIKADRDFIANIAADPADFAIAKAIADMVQAIGRICVAEGVETPAQREALHRLAIDAYQGWLISHPLPAPEFREFLHHSQAAAPLHT